jgi:uncharacterized protein with von Willebrand factor type A (vWA) domain
MENEERSILDFQFSDCVERNTDLPFISAAEHFENEFGALKKKAAGALPKDEFEKLSADVFFSFYNKNVELRKMEFVRLKYLFNHNIMENIINDAEYEKLRMNTAHNKNNSFEAMMLFMGKVAENLKDFIKSGAGKEHQILSDRMNELDENIIDELKKGKNGGKDAEKLFKEAQKLGDDLKNHINKNEKEYKKNVKKAMDSSSSEMKEAAELFDTVFGGNIAGTGPGELERLPIHVRLEYARRIKNNPAMKLVMEYAGRFKLTAYTKQVEKRSDIRIEPTDVKYGGDFREMDPKDMASLVGGNRVMREQLKMRIAKKELLELKRTFKEKDWENEGKGPVVVCVDTSGSMSGEKEYKSKAIALAAADIAFSQQRDFACVLFSSESEITMVKIKSGESFDAVIPKILDIGSIFYGGGTDFESPLKAAVEIIEKESFSRADIIFMTDGYAELSPGFLEYFGKVKEQKKFKVMGILCDSYDADRKSAREVMELFCDKLTYNTEMDKDNDFGNADDVAGDIFFNL